MTKVYEGSPADVIASAESPPETRNKAGRSTSKRVLMTFGGAVIAGTLIANAINGNSASSDAMGSWFARYGTTYTGISHDVVAVGVDANAQNPNLTTVRSDCAKLQSDVQRGRADPPMPIGSLQAQWSQILSNLSKGSQDCLFGIDQQSSASLNQGASYFTNAQVAYEGLLKAVQKYGG